MHDFQRHEFTIRGTVRMQVGHQYLAPLAWDPDVPDGSDVSMPTIFPVAHGTVAPAAGQDTRLAKQLSGKLVATVGPIFASASPAPDVRPFLSLPPSQRLAAMLRARDQASAPSTGGR